MKILFKSMLNLLKKTASEWVDDEATRLGAALAYYTVFSISPLVIIVIAIAGLFFDAATAQKQIFDQITSLAGPEGAQAIQSILASAKKPGAGLTATIVAVITLLIGATGVFVQLQDALNAIWNVEPKRGSGIWGFVKNRLLSFAMILGIGFLLLVSLILSAGLTAVGSYIGGFLPGLAAVWQIINFLVSFGVITVLFAMIFKFMPDVKIAWHDVWIGAVITALLFNIGKLLLGLYLAKGSVASAYGAAGSIVIILVWVYYSSQILFFGAEFTQVYANQYGSRPTPAKHDRAIKEESLPQENAAPLPIPVATARVVNPSTPAVSQPLRAAFPRNGFHPTKTDVGLALLFFTACLGSAKLLKNASKRWHGL